VSDPGTTMSHETAFTMGTSGLFKESPTLW
jgi:hypothetical protein